MVERIKFFFAQDLKKPRLRSPADELWFKNIQSYFTKSEQVLETVLSGYKQKWKRNAKRWHLESFSISELETEH